MYINFKKVLSVLALLTVGAVIGVVGVKMVQRYQAPKQTVSVVGNGEIDASTDQATISIQIKTSSDTYEKAQTENKKQVNDLKSELIKLGIPESRITTSSYSPPIIRNAPPEVDSIEAPGSKMMPIYRPDTTTPAVTTNLTLILDPIKNIEKVYDVVSKKTNAQITNSYYSLKNRKTWESKAKDEALKDARNQIESAAKINHLSVGKMISLVDTNSQPVTRPMMLKGEEPTNTGAFVQDKTTSSLQQEAQSENVYYSEQTVKITSSYTATYELY